MPKEIEPIETTAAVKNSQEELNYALVRAVRAHNPHELKRLLAAGADANSRDQHYSALGWVVRSANTSSNSLIVPILISILMEAGADPNLKKTDSDEKSPFICSCIFKRDDCILAMLDSDGPVKLDLSGIQPDNTFSPAMLIARNSSVNILEKMQKYFEKNILFNHNITDESKKFERGHLWLDFSGKNQNAFMHGSHESQRWIASQNFVAPRELTEMTDDKGRTALWIALDHTVPNFKSVEFLVSLGSRLDIANSSGETLLSMAKRGQTIFPALERQKIFKQLQAVDASRRAMAAIDEVMARSQGFRP